MVAAVVAAAATSMSMSTSTTTTPVEAAIDSERSKTRFKIEMSIVSINEYTYLELRGLSAHRFGVFVFNDPFRRRWRFVEENQITSNKTTSITGSSGRCSRRRIANQCCACSLTTTTTKTNEHNVYERFDEYLRVSSSRRDRLRSDRYCRRT